MDLNRFLKYFGMLFVVIGMVAGILFIGGALMTRSFPLIFMGVMFPLIVPVGMSAICPYCGRKVVAGKDGSIR